MTKLLNNLGELLGETLPQLFLDMDGVLTNFFDYFSEVTGQNYKELNDNQELFNNLTKQHIEGTDFFSKIPAHKNLNLILGTVKLTFGKYNILSAPLVNDVDNTIKNKNIWIDVKMVDLLPEKRIYTREKQKFARTMVTPNHSIANILIDDNLNNLKKWADAGGIGIKFKSNSDKYSTIDLAAALLKILSTEDFQTPRIIYLYDFVQYSDGKVKHLDLIDHMIDDKTKKEEHLKKEIVKFMNFLNDNETIDTKLFFNCSRHELNSVLNSASLDQLKQSYKHVIQLYHLS